MKNMKESYNWPSILFSWKKFKILTSFSTTYKFLMDKNDPQFLAELKKYLNLLKPGFWINLFLIKETVKPFSSYIS